eukprot:TCONS_00011021-protein
MKKIRRSFGSGKDQYPEEPPLLDLNKDVSENMRELLSEITKKELMSTSKRMGYLNNFSQLVRHFPNSADYGFPLDDIVACLRIALISAAKEVRSAGFRAYRHLLNDESMLTVFLNQRVDIFICKSLDLPPNQEVERVQALRLVRKMVYMCPRKFPLSVAMVLAAISVDSAHDKDRLSRACLATLCELAVQNVEIASYSGIIGAIVNNTLDCSIPRMNESLMCTILYLYNHPESRKFIRRRVGLEPILAPFTDLYYTYSSDLQDSQIKEDRIQRLESAKLALVSVIRSWAGLMNFCDPDGNSIASLLGVFALPNAEIKKAIIDTLYDVFLLRQPEQTTDFSIALQSVDPIEQQDNWKLTDQFLLAEADAVLPHRATSTRANLIENYLSLLLSAFLDADVLISLVKVITTSDDFICIRGSILLGEILHLTNVLLPPTHSGQTHCLPLLMSLATNLEKPAMERGKASAVVGYLDQIHKMKKRGNIANTLIMEQLISQVAKYENQGNKSKSRQEKLDLHYAWKEMDEVCSAIRETGMFTVGVQEFDFQMWNWDLISTVLESSKMTIKRSEDPIIPRFIKRLSTFYKPFQKLYSQVPLEDPMGRKYSEVALQLVDFLLRKDEQPEGEKSLIEILQDVRDCLGEAIQPGRLTGIFSTNNLSETLTRDYFLLIGRLSSTTEGLRILDKTSGIFQYLMEICSMGSRESLIKLIISCLDYGRDGISRVLLSKTLSAAPLTARLYATKFLRVLLRVKCPYFRIWGIEFLTNQLYDQEIEIVETAIEILEEACEDDANLQWLIEVRPILLHLGEKGIRLLSRYVSVTKGFTYLKEMDYLNPLVQSWKDNYNKEYVTWIELEIAESLSSYEKQAAQGGYIRRSNNRLIKRKNVYVLPHLYGELARHQDGLDLLEEENLISEAVDTIVQANTDTFEDIFQLKAALWAMGHVMSTRVGINFALSYDIPSRSSSFCQSDVVVVQEDDIKRMNEEKDNCDVINAENGEVTIELMDDPSHSPLPPLTTTTATANVSILDDSIGPCATLDIDDDNGSEDESPSLLDVIVSMASNSDVLSVRGTCFYVLGLVGSTSIGAEKLEYLGWDSVRHKCTVDWPVMEPDIAYVYDPDLSEDEEEGAGNGADEPDNTTSQAEIVPTQPEKFGGIYLGEELQNDEFGIEQDPFDYKVYVYGDSDKKKGKKSKTPVSDESRFFQDMAAMTERPPESNVRTKFFDIDSRGFMYEKHDEGFLAGLDRLNYNTKGPMNSMENAGGIYLGDEPTPSDTTTLAEEKLDTFEDFAPFLSGKIPAEHFMQPPPYQSPSMSSQIGKTKELFDSCGIYLGEVPDEEDDTIEANLSPVPLTNSSQPSTSPTQATEQQSVQQHQVVVDVNTSQPPEYTNARSYTIENSEPLKPIREEKYPENDIKTVNISIEGTLVDERPPLQQRTRNTDPGMRISFSEDFRNSTQSPVNMNDVSLNESRIRSISLTEDGARIIQETRSPRSASFSGTQQNKSVNRNSMRAGSDPGLGVISNSLTGSMSSQEGENGKKNYKKSGNRKKSRSETSDTSEHGRSNSILSDYGYTPGARSRMVKRVRGGSNVSLGVSPKSARSGSPLSREGAFGYTAWQSLKKQRSFKKELDWNLKRHLAASDKRRFGSRGFVSQYRRLMEASNHQRRASVPVITRKQLLVSSSFDLQRTSAPTEDYIGRALPRDLPDFFSVKQYNYVGSWADNFIDFTEVNNIQTFDKNFKHIKEKCLCCQINYAPIPEGKERSESDISIRSKSRSSSKEDATADEDSESSGRDSELSPKMKNNIRKDVLRLVANLSSAVASKNTQQEIIALHGRHPWAFRDLCLYSQVAEILGMFSFRMAIRRFIQKLFEGVDYQVVIESADMVLGRPLIYEESKN